MTKIPKKFRKTEKFLVFEIQPLHLEFRIFSKFFGLKKFIIFYTIFKSKPHPNSKIKQKVISNLKILKSPKRGTPIEKFEVSKFSSFNL